MLNTDTVIQREKLCAPDVERKCTGAVFIDPVERLRRFAIARGRSVSSVVAEGVEVLMELYEHDDNRCVSEVNREATQ
jgi:hypothetical protein